MTANLITPAVANEIHGLIRGAASTNAAMEAVSDRMCAHFEATIGVRPEAFTFHTSGPLGFFVECSTERDALAVALAVRAAFLNLMTVGLEYDEDMGHIVRVTRAA